MKNCLEAISTYNLCTYTFLAKPEINYSQDPKGNYNIHFFCSRQLVSRKDFFRKQLVS